ncbi:glycosyltransferase [Flavobacterium sp.]|uniref:glycosyltransferase n=3 Tax=Flavobacterium sp. TaxID=239 RepID=UPI0040339915
MRILINTATTFKGGGVQVANSFIKECRNYPENEYHVILGSALGKSLDRASFPDNFHFYDIPFRPATRVFSLKPIASFFDAIEAKAKPDVVFTTSGPSYWRPKAPHLTGYNLPHYIYPESPFFAALSPIGRLKWYFKGAFIIYFFKKGSDAYVVQTDDVNTRLRKLLGTDKVATVSNTCSTYYYDPATFPDRLPARKEGEFRMLTLSAWYPHKNLSVIPKVVDSLEPAIKDRVRFVVTLPEDVYEQHFEERYRQYVLNVGVVPMEQGPSLYKECDAMFLPTLLECFSASYAEAMAMEKPILTSDMGFAHTICADAALYFDPVDANAIAAQIKKLILSPESVQDLINKGTRQLKAFGSAGERAQKYLKIAEELIKNT